MKKMISKKNAYRLVKNFDKHGALLGFGFDEGENRIKGKYESHDMIFNETYLGIRKAIGTYLSFLLAAKPKDYSVSDADFCKFFGFTLDEVKGVEESSSLEKLNHSFYDKLIKKYKKCTYPKAIKAIDDYGKINFGISDRHDAAFKLMLKEIKGLIRSYKNFLKENSKFPLDLCDDDDVWVSSYKKLFTLEFVWDKRSKECSEDSGSSWDGFTDEERSGNNSNSGSNGTGSSIWRMFYGPEDDWLQSKI